ncbi:MAG: hypothetical protein IKR13_03405 [Victivallales bacterium]|nr:hypothetical protein [Victivallales bacterium]
MATTEESALQVVQCLGCDASCEVYVEIRDGQPVCRGGNNCPTGAQFACAQCRPAPTSSHQSAT